MRICPKIDFGVLIVGYRAGMNHDAELAAQVANADFDRANIARMYDYHLGGSANFAIDRETAEQALKIAPTERDYCFANRAFLGRAVRHLVTEVGIDQFLDCGSGLPTAENTHEVAQRANPEAMVVYIDHDPVVVAHGKALLDDNEHTHIALADFTRVEELCQVPAVARNIDFSRPVALLHGSSLHHVPDEADPWGVVRRSLAGLASGSYLAVSHVCVPRDPEMAAVAERVQ